MFSRYHNVWNTFFFDNTNRLKDWKAWAWHNGSVAKSFLCKGPGITHESQFMPQLPHFPSNSLLLVLESRRGWPNALRPCVGVQRRLQAPDFRKAQL